MKQQTVTKPVTNTGFFVIHVPSKSVSVTGFTDFPAIFSGGLR
ncbi:hypothetical protein [Pseudoduganella lutea]|nr:hypothetical protein [Pseudoduganella lutea]